MWLSCTLLFGPENYDVPNLLWAICGAWHAIFRRLHADCLSEFEIETESETASSVSPSLRFRDPYTIISYYADGIHGFVCPICIPYERFVALDMPFFVGYIPTVWDCLRLSESETETEFGFAFAIGGFAFAIGAVATLIQRLCLFRVCDDIVDATNLNDYAFRCKTACYVMAGWNR